MKVDINKKYTLKQISDIYDISIDTLRYRCMKLELTPIIHNGKYQFGIESKDVFKILERPNKTAKVPDIIYVTRSTETYPSKLNYLPLNKL